VGGSSAFLPRDRSLRRYNEREHGHNYVSSTWPLPPQSRCREIVETFVRRCRVELNNNHPVGKSFASVSKPIKTYYNVERRRETFVRAIIKLKHRGRTTTLVCVRATTSVYVHAYVRFSNNYAVCLGRLRYILRNRARLRLIVNKGLSVTRPPPHYRQGNFHILTTTTTTTTTVRLICKN